MEVLEKKDYGLLNKLTINIYMFIFYNMALLIPADQYILFIFHTISTTYLVVYKSRLFFFELYKQINLYVERTNILQNPQNTYFYLTQ